MAAAPDDWRRTGQERRQLPPGTVLTRKRYRARSQTWEHEHCLSASPSSLDPEFSEAHRRFIEEHPEVLKEGYTSTAAHERGVDRSWVCPPCLEDFADELALRVVQS
ncbi:MAG: hypothetical protein M3459_12650 [Actinomycetota bacterium]|nr:hypothetical protein [Actinomycetota bacterium]